MAERLPLGDGAAVPSTDAAAKLVRAEHSNPLVDLAPAPRGRCAECGCADNCDECRRDGCRECWKAHRRRGLAWCDRHGVVQPCSHTGKPRRLCDWPQPVDPDGSPVRLPKLICDLGVVAKVPAAGHAHCPACWAFSTLFVGDGSRWNRPPAPCASCRRLLTDELLELVVADIETIWAVQARGLEFAS